MLITVDGHMGGSFYYPLFLFICLKFSLTNSFKKKKKNNLLSHSKALSLIWPGTTGVLVDMADYLTHLFFPSGLGGHSLDTPFLNLQQ